MKPKNIFSLKLPAVKCTLVLMVLVSSMLMFVPAHAEQSKWSNNALLKALYFNRSGKERVCIIGGAAVAATLICYIAYKALTRTEWEKNLLALEQIERDVKKQYWHRVKTEEIEPAPKKAPSFKLMLDSYAKNSMDLTLLSAVEKERLRTYLIAAANAIHDPRVSKEQLVRACEVDFSGFVKTLNDNIVVQQQLNEQQQNLKKQIQKMVMQNKK